MSALPAVPGNRWDLLDGLSPAGPPRVSVVVVHFEQPVQLARTLAALARQTHPRDRMEVIVVDDGSTTPPEVPAGVRLLAQPDRGFRAAAARNLGAAHATGDVLLFLDADTTPEPEYVARLTRLPALAPEAVVVGRRRHAALDDVGPGSPIEDAGPAHELPPPEWLEAAYARTRDLLDADDRSYRFVISAVLGCSRAFFAETGGFDASMDAYGGEDWEWAHRAWRDGALFAHVRDAVAWHDGPDFAGRAPDPAVKNAETLRLARMIPIAGSRPRALHGGRPDVLVRLADAPSPAAAFLCADSVLHALPEATIVVPAAVRDALGPDARVVTREDAAWRPRVVVELPSAVRVAGPDLRAAVDDPRARTDLVDAGGTLRARVVGRRAQRRAVRGRTEPEILTRTTEDLVPLGAEPDLEAALGGWE